MRILGLLFYFLICLSLQPASAATCDENGLINDCTFTPEAIQFTLLAIGLCKGLPNEPTASEPTDLSKCEIVYDRIGQSGQRIELTGPGQEVDIGSDLTVPIAGTYDYSLFAYTNGIQIKKSWSLASEASAYRGGNVVTTGKFCWSISENWINNDGQPRFAFECGPTLGTAQYTYRDFWARNGVAGNQCGGKDYWIQANKKVAQDWNSTDALVSFRPLNPPVVIGPETRGLDLTFRLTDFLTLNTRSYFGEPGIFVSDVSVLCAAQDLSTR